MAEKKMYFYPEPLDGLLNKRPTSINKEKETEFEQRKLNMDKDAVKEEKLRGEKEKSQKFVESEFQFRGEGEEIGIQDLNLPKDLAFKSSTKMRRNVDQSFSMVGYANLPQSLREFFKIKKTERPMETNSIEYLKFDKSTHPSTYKYAKNVKIRKIESNIKNLYDISMNSLLTTAEITKRAEILAKLYMKYNYDEKAFGPALDEEEKRNNQKKFEKFLPKANTKARDNTQSLSARERENSVLSHDSNESPNTPISEQKRSASTLLPPPNLNLKTSSLPPPTLTLPPVKL